MAKVAIIGSCITRDLWPILGEAPEDLLYISRTSLPSLFSPRLSAAEIATDPPRGLGRHQNNAIGADVRKSSLDTLIAHSPTHLIFDFIDERFDLLAIGDTIVTHSWELETSGYLDQPAFQPARIVPRGSAECARLWRDAAEEFSAFLKMTPLAGAQVIVHESAWAREFLDRQGRRRAFDPEVMIFEGNMGRIDDHDGLLQNYQAAFADLTGAARVRAHPALALGDVTHRWGLSPFHYVAEYYHDVFRQLRALGI